MEIPQIGITIKKKTTVTPELLASYVGSGTIQVYATPMVVALMEKAAAALVQPYLDEGITTVGTRIAIDHLSATPQDAQVYAVATLTALHGRKFDFSVEAYDNGGLIAKGEHTRFSVKADTFLKKAQEKLEV